MDKKKLQRLLRKVTVVTTEHQKGPKISQNSKQQNSSFLAQRAKKVSDGSRSPPQELDVSPQSRLYLIQRRVLCLVAHGINKIYQHSNTKVTIKFVLDVCTYFIPLGIFHILILILYSLPVLFSFCKIHN